MWDFSGCKQERAGKRALCCQGEAGASVWGEKLQWQPFCLCITQHLPLGKKAMINLDSILKSRDITLLTKVHLVKAMVFPVVVYEFKNCIIAWERERWQRNRTGRSLSPSQIPQKNISTPSKLHKTTSVGWQRTSGNQKSRPLSSKTGRKKYKRRKRRQRRWGGSSVPGREARPGKGILRREVSKHQETLSLPSLWRALETQRAT